jgi:hypothetical protein
MQLPIYVKSPNNNSKWQMGFNSAFRGLKPGFSSLVLKRAALEERTGVAYCIYVFRVAQKIYVVSGLIRN